MIFLNKTDHVAQICIYASVCLLVCLQQVQYSTIFQCLYCFMITKFVQCCNLRGNFSLLHVNVCPGRGLRVIWAEGNHICETVSTFKSYASAPVGCHFH